MQADGSPKKTRLWLRLLFWGCLFEVALIISAVLIRDGGSPVEIYNFAVIVHAPFFWLAEILRLGAVGAILLLLLWPLLWAAVFYGMLRAWNWSQEQVFRSRKQKLFFKLALGLVLLIFLLPRVMSYLPAKSVPFAASPDTEKLVQGNTAFALDLYQQLKSQPGNLFFSPYSISTALAMTSAGARGETEKEISQAFHFNLSPTNLHESFGTLTSRLKKLERWNRIELKNANSLWCQKDHYFLPAFLNTVRDRYNGDAREVDFDQSPEAASREINHWIETRTKKITHVIDPTQLVPATKLVLCNAIYFKGKWQTQFKPSDTKPESFHIDTNQIVTVPMMRLKAHFKTAYSEDRGVQMLELPYVGNDLSLVIFLPEEGFGESETEPGKIEMKPAHLKNLEKEFNPQNLQNWLSLLDKAALNETWVYLPRFRTTQNLNLKNSLNALGIRTAFSPNADFSGMDGTTNLYLSEVLQTAFVDVNESGTEAAAVTIVMAKTKGMNHRFRVDHPFIFLIRDKGSGSILFLGRMVDPTK